MAAHRPDNRTGVQPSKLGAQPIGEVAEVVVGIYQLRIPVPIPLGFVSAYLIGSPDGWTLLDTGFDYPDGRAVWEAGAPSIGLDLQRDVSRNLVSHFHPDHLGAARWLQELSGAPAYMLGEEIEHARLVWESDGGVASLINSLVLNGMLHELAEEAGSGMRANLKLPEKLLPLRAGDEMSLGSSVARAVHAPGHAEPEIGDEEVLIHVHAAGVDRGVWHVMTGLPYPIRLAGYGFRAPKNPVIGSDVAGVVEAVGKEVTRFQPGDEVFGIGKGSYAEYVCAREDKLAPKPANLTFEQAAVLAISGSIALQAVRDHGRVGPGQEVLIVGASGGVGAYAVQIARAFGAHVTGVCSAEKVEMVRSIGADRVIDYRREDFAKGERRYDLILDIGGNSSLARLRRVLQRFSV